MSKLILASSSRYRQALLSRLGLNFISFSPDIDETPFPEEAPIELVKRLSIGKATSVAESYPTHFVLGSDQVAVFQQQIIGKPNSFENALEQLTTFSGNSVQFLTGVALVNKDLNFLSYAFSEVTANFRDLNHKQITRYIETDQPYDCAGSFKIEQYGISLFDSVISDDPTSLEGFPLIKVCSLFRSAGLLE